MADQHDDDWCGTQEAARRLGVTPAAVRNRIKRRTIEVKANGNIGRLVRVPRTLPSTVPSTDPEPGPDARALIALLQRRVAELDGEVKELRPKAARAEVLEALLAAEQARSRRGRLWRTASLPRQSRCWPLKPGAPGGRFAEGRE